MKAQNSKRFLLVVTCLLYVSFGLLSSVIGVIIDRFQSDYDVSLAVAGLLPFAFFLAYGLTSIPFGLAMDRFGAKRMLLSGLLLMCLGSLLLYFSSHYIVVILMIFVIGVGVTAVQIIGNPFIRELDKPARYNANLTTIIGIGALGYAISPLLVPFMEARGYSWRTVYLLFACVNFVILLLLYFSRFPKIEIQESEKIKVTQVKKLLSHPIIMTYALGIFLYVGGEVGVSSFIISFMDEIHGLGSQESFWASGTFLNKSFPSKSALIVALFWLFQALGRIVISFLMRFFSERSIFIFHALGTVITLIIAINAAAGMSLWFFALVGYFTCASFTALFSATINSFDAYHGTISGILGTAIVGGAVVGWLVGYIGQTAGLKWGMAVNVLAFSYVAYMAIWGRGKLDLKHENDDLL